MKDLKIVFFGSSYFVIPVLEALLKEYQVVAVVTAPDAVMGRKKILTPSPIKDCYSSINNADVGKVFTPTKMTSKSADPHFIESLKALEPDLIIIGSYGRLIPQAVIDLPRYGSINIHPSLLPKFRGPTPVPAAILAGDQISGISIIKMDNQMDHGPIIAQEAYALPPNDTAKELLEKMWVQATALLMQTLPDFIAGNITLNPQEESRATYCKLIHKEDGYFDVAQPPQPEILQRMVRAYYPWPTAWTRWNDKVVKLYPKLKIQIEGKSQTDIKSFLNGYPDFPLKTF